MPVGGWTEGSNFVSDFVSVVKLTLCSGIVSLAYPGY